MKNSTLCQIVSIALGLPLISGCGTDTALQNVNKDWNKAIRAMHVYPVNPLTQDIQPGDIFFTDKSIEDTSSWDVTGYLPLDHNIARLYPTNYAAYYEHSFALGAGTNAADFLPRLWLHDNSWSNAPVAAFPGYTFSVTQGGAINVSLPIEGVPVGLGLMGAKSASGSVTITDANTYGIDEMSMLEQVENFMSDTNVAHKLLKQFPKGATGKTNQYFLQVVSRVYTTHKVAVSMINESSFGGSLSAGAAPSNNLPNFQGTNAAVDYSNLVSAVNAVVSSSAAATGAAPGGSLKFTHVSSRSVSMEESFAKPVLIGYTGFSVPITYNAIKEIADAKTNRIHVRRLALDPARRDRQMSE